MRVLLRVKKMKAGLTQSRESYTKGTVFFLFGAEEVYDL